MKYTAHNLKKLESLFEELGYIIRYEKGNFQSGYCIVEDRKIVVINKFFDTEGRINSLLDILPNIPAEGVALSDAAKRLYQELLQTASHEAEKPS